MLLSDPEFDGGTALLGAEPPGRKTSEDKSYTPPGQASTAGRADDFSTKLETPASAGNADTTTATAR